jgi:hypothetical protein
MMRRTTLKSLNLRRERERKICSGICFSISPFQIRLARSGTKKRRAGDAAGIMLSIGRSCPAGTIDADAQGDRRQRDIDA